MTESQPLEINPKNLSPEAFNGIIENYILREGTDYGQKEVSFQKKKEQVEKQIEKGLVKIFFDPETESIQLLNQEEVAKIQKKAIPKT